MLILKVNIHNVHLLENPMKSTAYPLLPPPGTLKATEYFTIILLFVRRRANKQQRGTNITWPINILGMSAVFLGPFVEKDIKKSALISTVCFACRFAGTGASIAAGCPGVLIFYGVIMGIGLGVGYLTPVKNLMLWFAKGLATGIAVAGFGLAKAIAGSISVILTVDAVFNAAGAA